ncbi:MAG TPA: GGDEF domain-containing protein, partial [Candidatus Omnitrophica bacterium]|nr:GGDEF domain-containing protein [Candidatus Omnitrophota bacterium]
YGGEEFAIILTQTTRDQGMVIAERIRENVAKHPFQLSGEANEEKLHVTVSIGLGTFPEDAQTKEELIAKADKAMYIAKFSGKNRTCS